MSPKSVKTSAKAELNALIMAEVQDHPGSWTDKDIATTLRAPVGQVRSAVYRLSEAGAIAPRAYRLHPAMADRVATAQGIHALCWSAASRRDGVEVAVKVVTLLRDNGPLPAADLAQHFDAAVLPGNVKKLVRTLDEHGVVSPPTCLWPGNATTTHPKER